MPAHENTLILEGVRRLMSERLIPEDELSELLSKLMRERHAPRAARNGTGESGPAPDDRLSRRTYQVHEFFAFQGSDFVLNAFTQLLKRTPDKEEIEPWAARLIADPVWGRLDVLQGIAQSDEAALQGTRISDLEEWVRSAAGEGLGPASAPLRQRLLSLPVVGPWLHRLALILNLPGIEAELTQIQRSLRQSAHVQRLTGAGVSNRLVGLSAEADEVRVSQYSLHAAVISLTARVDSMSKGLDALRDGNGTVGRFATEDSVRRAEIALKQLKSDMDTVGKPLVREVENLKCGVAAQASRLEEVFHSLNEFSSALPPADDVIAIAEHVRNGRFVMQDAWLSLRQEVDRIVQTEEARHNGLERELDQQKRNVLDIDRRIALLLEEARRRMPETYTAQQLSDLTSSLSQFHESMYVRFEDIYRGSRDDIKSRQRVYLDRVLEVCNHLPDAPVLDLGCGRGEWLELLRESNIRSLGIDSNAVMIERCRELDLPVKRSDLLEYLSHHPTASLAAVTAFHVVEHLKTDVLIRMLDEAFRVLRPGGLLICETPNPGNLLVACTSFYMDPTHERPVPPLLLQFLAEQRGFVRNSLVYLHPHPEYLRLSGSETEERLNQLLYGPQDYAVIGYKA